MTELKESKSAGGAAVGSRPWPLADELTAPFWDAAAAQRLVVQRCTECALLRFPPSAHCSHCHSDGVEWAELSGRATLYSFIIDHRNMIPGFEGAYTVALATPDEVTDDSIRFVTNVPGCPPEDLRIGMPLTVTFEVVHDGVTLPQFVPEAGS
jgi:hypothetical protein